MEIDELRSIIFLVAFGMLLIIVIAVVIMQVSSKMLLKEKLKKEELEVAHKKELLFHAIQTQEKERDRLAAEIHDDITSKLNAISVHMNLLANGLTEEGKKKIETLNKVVEAGIIDSRRIAYDLYPVVLEKFGLHTAIDELVSLNSSENLKVVLKSNIEDDTYTAEKAVHIYRIFQELFQNSIKYAQCSLIQVGIHCSEGQTTLEFKDNGVGSPQSIQKNEGMGMKNIRSRLSILDGEMEISAGNPGLHYAFIFQA